MKILIIGANSQIGYEFLQLSLVSTNVIICLDRKRLDLSEDSEIYTVVRDIRPDIVINCAAYTAVDNAEIDTDRAYCVNAWAPGVLAMACDVNNAVLIHISTDYVFSGNSFSPYLESDETGPASVYGKSKLSGELAIALHLKKYIILRTSWVFGVHGNNFVKTMLRLGTDSNELDIVADQIGSPTSARGVAQCCLSIVDKIQRQPSNINWGVYHFSGDINVSWYDFACVIFKKAVELKMLTKVPVVRAIRSDQFQASAPRPKNSRLDCKKVKKNFDIKADDWETQLDRCLRFLERESS